MIVAADIFDGIVSTIGHVLGGAASSAAAGIITVFARAVLGSLTRAIEWLSTVWMNTPTPTLTDTAGNPTGTVAWMQRELLPLTAALAVGSVIVGGAKLAIAEAGHTEAREFTRWLFVYALASAGGVAFAATLVATCDGFANYIIAQATTGSNFGDHLAQGLGLMTHAVGSATAQPQGGFLLGLAGTAGSAVLAIIIGAIALIASFVEFVLMAFRGGVLVILCGLIPLAAAFSNLPSGERWLRRIAGWIVALAMYKLAAAFCYAAAFRLSAGTDVIAVMDGLALLVVSVLALPVLLRLTLPAAEHFTLHRGAAASTRTAIGTMPTGAIRLAASGAGGAAVMATGAAEQLAGTAGRGAGAGGGGRNQNAGASPDGGTDATGSAAAPQPGSRSARGAGGAKGSDGASGRPAGSANEASIQGRTSTSFPVGRGDSPDSDASGAGGGPAMPASAPEGGAQAQGRVERSRVDHGVSGESAPGGSDVPCPAQSRPSGPADPGTGEDPSGTGESWSGD